MLSLSLPLPIVLLESPNPFKDFNHAFVNIPAFIDGTIAFVLLILSIYIGFTSLLPLPEPPIAVQGIIGFSVFILFSIIAQVLFTKGTLSPEFLPGLIRDLLMLGFSVVFARHSIIGLIVLLGYSAIWALPDAINRCAGVCPFAQIEQFIPW